MDSNVYTKKQILEVLSKRGYFIDLQTLEAFFQKWKIRERSGGSGRQYRYSMGRYHRQQHGRTVDRCRPWRSLRYQPLESKRAGCGEYQLCAQGVYPPEER